MALKKFQIIDAHLTEIAQGYKLGNTVYDQVMPPVKTPKLSGKFIKWDAGSFKIESSRRAMNSDVVTSDHDFDTDSYSMPDGYSRSVSVDDRQDRQTIGISNLNLLAQKISIARRQMEYEKEIEIASIVTDVGNFGTNHGPVDNAGSGGWSSVDADIYGDVDAAKAHTADLIGEEPNKLIITRDIRTAMRKNLSLQKFFLNTNPGEALLIDKKLSEIFEMEVIVATAAYMNSLGQRANIWGTAKAIMIYSAPTTGPTLVDPSDLAPSFGWTLQLDANPSVRKGYDQKNGIEWAVIEDNWLGLQTSSDAGYFFDAPLT